jgi:ArsR family transcriptional regulator
MSIQELPVLGPTPACAPNPLVREVLGEDEAVALAGVLKALADPVRLRLVSMIAAHEGGQVCACELADPLGRSQPTVSHHLKTLREAGILASEKRATWIYYRIVPEALAQLAGLLAPLGAGVA